MKRKEQLFDSFSGLEAGVVREREGFYFRRSSPKGGRRQT